MSLQNKKILVTGGAGFIGSNLAIRLVEEGARVSVLDALIPETGANPLNLLPVKEQIQNYQRNLLDNDGLGEIIKGQDIIFNLVGQVSHQDSLSNPKWDMEINVAAQLNLLEACRLYNPSVVIVYTSTRQVYGIPQYLPVDEKHPVSPVDFNGVSNLAGEQYHSLYFKIFNIKTVSLRLTNTYGPRQLIKHNRQGFLGWFANRAILGKPIYLYGGGEQVRDLNYVDDVVEALILASQTEDCFGKTFNLSGKPFNLNSIAEQFIRITGKGEIKFKDFPEELKKIDIGNYYGSSELFFQKTRWRPKVDLTEGLEKTIHFFQAHLVDYLGNEYADSLL